MPSHFTIEDLIDLEYFGNMDQRIEDSSNSSQLHKRDRQIYISSIQPTLPETRKKSELNRFILSRWLHERREAYTKNRSLDAILPGDIFRNVYNGVLIATVIFCFLCGSGAAMSYLVYYGVKPVNVTLYLSVFVALQFFLFFITCFYLFIKIINRKVKGLPISQNVLFIIFMNFFSKAVKSAENQLSKGRRDIIDSKIAFLKQKKKVFRSIITWPVFNLVQIGSFFFNSGVLLATLFRVFTSDLAFGWQTTFQLGETTVYKIITSASVLWSWFIPSPLAHPTLDQVRGTHIVLKEGIFHMKTSDLTSWWPFLCFAVLFYGVLPRLFLLVFGRIRQQNELKNLDIDGISLKKILLRMQTPIVSSRGEPETDSPDISAGSSASPKSPAPFIEPIQPHYQAGSCILIPEDIVSTINKQEVKDLIYSKYGFNIEKIKTIHFDTDMDKQILEEIKMGDIILIFIIQEAWQPPIQEKILFLKELLGIEKVKNIILSLIGKPGKNSCFTFPEENDMLIWSKAVQSFGDPRIKSEILNRNE
ncbi:MAG: DUF2868 domain-containing protein [Chitinispirillia bacterium]|jgi:hypothetical protein